MRAKANPPMLLTPFPGSILLTHGGDYTRSCPGPGTCAKEVAARIAVGALNPISSTEKDSAGWEPRTTGMQGLLRKSPLFFVRRPVLQKLQAADRKSYGTARWAGFLAGIAELGHAV